MSVAAVDPRAPQITEMGQAALNAAKADSREVREWWRGVMVGYAVAFGLSPEDPLTDAHNTPLASAAPLEDLQRKAAYYAAAGLRGSSVEVWHRSGVLWGWKQATSERTDAQECAWCERRILTDTDTEAFECRNHGWLCDDDCRHTMCEGRQSCWEDN